MFLSSDNGFEGCLPRKRELIKNLESTEMPKKKMKSHVDRTTSIPSCGLTLLSGPKNSFDYVLRITSDDQQFVQIHCHRCVLIAHSPQMASLINGENYFDMSLKVKFGYIGACLELIQYFYLKDPTLISEKEKILELCGLFEMSLDHFLIRENKLEAMNCYPMVTLNVVADQSSCVTSIDFLKCIEWEKAKVLNHEIITTTTTHGCSLHTRETSEPLKDDHISGHKGSNPLQDGASLHSQETWQPLQELCNESSLHCQEETWEPLQDSCNGLSQEPLQSHDHSKKLRPTAKRTSYNLRKRKR